MTEYWPLGKSFTSIHLFVTNSKLDRLDTVGLLRYFTMFYFYNTCLNSFNIYSLSSGEIIIFSTFLAFLSTTGFICIILSWFDLATASAILFPINSPVTSAALWTFCLETVFKASSPLSKIVPYICYKTFSRMIKIHIL